MDSQIMIVMAVAVLDDDIVADLEADAIAVVVSALDLTHMESIAVLKEDAPSIVAVEILIVGPIPIENEILDGDIGCPFAGQQGKQRRASRLPASHSSLEAHHPT